MKKILLGISAACLMATLPLAGNATPEEDLKMFRDYYSERFPNIPLENFKDGVYAIDEGSREQWEAIEEFPPYDPNIDAGEEMFNTPFANGKSYADCFENGGVGIKQNYPYYEDEGNRVVTLEIAINDCRKANGEEPLKGKKGAIADLSAYMSFTSRGNTVDVKVPTDNPGAMAAYEKGRTHFFKKRGQLNMACADCHMKYAGNKIRTELLGPAIGQVTHFPVYRSKWGALGTLHRRYGGCNEQVRAKSFKAQGQEYAALEYFHTHMSNGLELNGPGARK